jgi:hypothetical protein
MLRPYIVKLDVDGTSRCCACGKKIKKVYVLLSTRQEFGSECIKSALGLTVSDEELSVPVWLLQVADQYVNFRISEAKSKGCSIENGDDFAINFYNISFGVDMVLWDKRGFALVDNGKTIKISGKSVKADWQDAIFHYLMQRRSQLN